MRTNLFILLLLSISISSCLSYNFCKNRDIVTVTLLVYIGTENPNWTLPMNIRGYLCAVLKEKNSVKPPCMPAALGYSGFLLSTPTKDEYIRLDYQAENILLASISKHIPTEVIKHVH